MIKELRIKNFQSHNESKLLFNKGVNIIIGPTDSGKSAIIRALRNICYNEPNGDGFRSDWGGDTEIKIKTESNLIRKLKTNSNHVYSLDKLDFTAFGTNVPEEIEKAINMTDVNLQKQMDSPFLLNETSGAVARYFNKIANLDKIDKALSNVNSTIRALNQEQKFNRAQIKEKKELLENYEYLEEAETLLEEVESLQENYTVLESSTGKLPKLISELKSIQESKQEFTELIKPEKAIDELIELHEQKTNFLKSKQDLLTIQSSLLEIKNKQRKQRKITKAETLLNEIEGLLSKYDVLNLEWVQLKTKPEQLQTLKERIQKGKKYLTEIEQEYHDTFPDICPLCNQKTK